MARRNIEFEEAGLYEIRTKLGEKKGLCDSEKVIIKPEYVFISKPWPYQGGYIFIVKDEDWHYGIAFFKKGMDVADIWISPFTTKIINLHNGWFAAENVDYLFDKKGKPKE